MLHVALFLQLQLTANVFTRLTNQPMKAETTHNRLLAVVAGRLKQHRQRSSVDHES